MSSIIDDFLDFLVRKVYENYVNGYATTVVLLTGDDVICPEVVNDNSRICREVNESDVPIIVNALASAIHRLFNVLSYYDSVMFNDIY